MKMDSKRDQYMEIDEEVEKLIDRNKLTEAKVVRFKSVKPLLQNGPTCGLVALTMASQDLEKPIPPNLFFQIAHARGFTCLGEIFSVDYMETLTAKYLLSLYKPEIVSDLVESGSTKYFVNALSTDCIALIAYDSDANHTPCLKRGRKAHWALIVGLISSREGYHVLARHGKSRHLACWSLDDLIQSNWNLEEEPAPKDTGNYVIPDGGVGGKKGLRGRALLLYVRYRQTYTSELFSSVRDFQQPTEIPSLTSDIETPSLI